MELKAPPKIKEVKILAIDPATNCGWAVSKDIYGCWNLKQAKDESWGMKLIRFKRKLIEVCSSEDISIIVYERPAGMHKHSIITQSKIIGVLEAYCAYHDIDYRAFSSSEIKKFATGKGNCNKQAMVEAAKTKYGYDGKDDNEADALHLLHLAKKELTYNAK